MLFCEVFGIFLLSRRWNLEDAGLSRLIESPREPPTRDFGNVSRDRFENFLGVIDCFYCGGRGILGVMETDTCGIVTTVRNDMKRDGSGKKFSLSMCQVRLVGVIGAVLRAAVELFAGE